MTAPSGRWATEGLWSVQFERSQIARRRARHSPIWLAVSTLAQPRITVIQKRWSECRGDVRWFGLHPDVFEYLPDVGTVRDEGDQAHPATAVRPLSG